MAPTHKSRLFGNRGLMSALLRIADSSRTCRDARYVAILLQKYFRHLSEEHLFKIRRKRATLIRKSAPRFDCCARHGPSSRDRTCRRPQGVEIASVGPFCVEVATLAHQHHLRVVAIFTEL